MAAALAVMATGCSSDGPEDGMPLRKYDEPSWQDTPYRSITMDAGTRAVAGRTEIAYLRRLMHLRAYAVAHIVPHH